MFRRLFPLVWAAFMLALTCEPAKADPIVFFGGRSGTGVTAQVSNYSLTGNTFTFSVRNTSSTGTITAIGFDLPGNRPNNYTLSYSNYPRMAIKMDVSASSGAETMCGTNCGVFDLALMSGKTYGGGNVRFGIQAGSTATFTITGDFTGMSAQQVAESLSLRFQGVGPRDLSDVAEPTATSPSTPTGAPSMSGADGVESLMADGP
ncbi:MAG TPA: hypothetical protein VGV38_05355 [Pyrinomonadaceae bacterium]|nr:hypothetical protein [Pyrinomonadaceae bacterium]